MKRIIIISGILLIIITVLVFFLNKNNYNFFKIGNNKSNKEISDIEDYILNIDSYEAQVEVNVISNKNSNKYLINQKYKSPNIFTQKVIEPSNIAGCNK